jgi:ABC-type amino acid transport substrate-binding protein
MTSATETRPTIPDLIAQAERMAVRAATFQEDWTSGKLPTTRYAGQDARDDMKGAAALMAVANGRIMAELNERAGEIAQALDVIASVGIAAQGGIHDTTVITATKAMLMDKGSAATHG